jgi:hypothetical protein
VPEKRLLQASGASTITDAIEQTANQLLGYHRTVPVNLSMIGKALGVRISVANGHALGETHHSATGEEVRIRPRDQQLARQRFTLAHEYAHVVLDRIATLRATDSLEQLCDRIAAAVLMPREEFLECIRRGDTIPKLARDFTVSVHAAAVRYTELTGCAVFRVVAPSNADRQQRFGFREAGRRDQTIKRLGGPLSASRDDVRRAILDSIESSSVSVVMLGTRAWHVETVRTGGGDLLCIFRPRG